MPDKQNFIENWLINHPQDDETDAEDAWKLEVKFINGFCDWDNQLDIE